MKRNLILACLLGTSLAAASAARADCNDPFGKPEEVLDFHFKIARADWVKLLAERVRNPDTMELSAACMDQYTEFKSEFRCGNEGPFLKVALRRKKGEERGVEAFEKPPMKFDINEDFMGMVPEARGQRWPASAGDLGFRKLTLNNGTANKAATGVSVLSVLHSEHVGLRLLNKDVPLSPRTAYAKVTMHFDGAVEGEYLGVYILIEDLDRTALRRRGLAGTGNYEKQSTAGCMPEPEFADGPPNDSRPAFDQFLAKNPSQFSGTWLAEANKGLDVDTLLRQEAIREILVNGNDTIFNSVNPPSYQALGREGWGNNYYTYDPRVGRRLYAPWDMDLAFGQQNTFCGPTYVPGGRNLQCPATNPLLTYCTGGMPYPKTISNLGLRLACNPEVQKRYLQIMCQQTQGPLAADEILKVWTQVDNTLRPVIPLETARSWKGVNPLAPPPDATILETYGSEYERLRAWIPARIKFVQDEITRLGVPCAATCQNGATDSCSHLGCPSMRRCENGKWTPCTTNTSCFPALPPPPDGGPPPGTPDGGAGGSGPTPPGTGGAGGGGGAPAPTAGAPGGAGAGGAGGSAGSSPPSGAAGRSGSGGAPPAMPPTGSGDNASGGCACDMGAPRTTSSMMPLGVFIIALAAASLRRRRRR